MTETVNIIREVQQMYFIQASDGPIKIGISNHPATTLAAFQTGNAKQLTLVAFREAGALDMTAVRAMLRPHHIRADWFAPSPEVLDVVHGRVTLDGRSVRTGGRKLGDAEALEVFRLVHGTGLTYAAIAERFAVSYVSVAQIARGATYRHLWRKEPAPPLVGRAAGTARGDDYYISEARDGAPKYRMTPRYRSVR